MSKLLLVAAICCSILSTYGADSQKEPEKCGDYEPMSMACYAMQYGGGAEGLCKQSWLILFEQVCYFSCSETGGFMLENCHVCNDYDTEYPSCNDLVCVEADTEQQSSEDTTAGNEYDTPRNEYNTPPPTNEPTTGYNADDVEEFSVQQ